MSERALKKKTLGKKMKKAKKEKKTKDAPPVLPPLDEAPVEVDADRPLVEHGPAEVFDGVLGVRAGVEDD